MYTYIQVPHEYTWTTHHAKIPHAQTHTEAYASSLHPSIRLDKQRVRVPARVGARRSRIGVIRSQTPHLGQGRRGRYPARFGLFTVTADDPLDCKTQGNTCTPTLRAYAQRHKTRASVGWGIAVVSAVPAG